MAANRHDNARRSMMIILMAVILLVPAGMLSGTDAGPNDGPGEDPPTRAWLDVAIEGIDTVQKTQSNNIYPGQMATIQVGLVHDNRPYPSEVAVTSRSNAFDLVIVIDDGFDNVTTRYTRVNNLPLLNGSTNGPNGQPNPLFIYFDWQAPHKPPEGVSGWNDFQFSVHATITINDDDKSDNFKSGPGIRISKPEFEPYIFEPGQTEGSDEGPPIDVAVGETLFIPFELHNLGPNVDMIGIEYLSVPEGWVPQAFDETIVYPSDFEEMNLALYVSPDPMKALNKRYEIIARAYSAYYPEGPYPTNSEHTFRFDVEFKPGCKVEPIEQSTDIVPGEKTNVEFELKNTGNGLDSYRLRYELSQKALNDGWEISEFPSLTKPVIAGGTSPVRFKLEIPTTTARYSNANILITAESQTDTSYKTEGKKMTIFADIFYDAEIEDFEQPFLVQPGKENIIRFNFTNMGNDRDPNQYLEVFRSPPGWSIYIDQSPIKAFNGIGPKTIVPIEMNVVVPESAQTTEESYSLPQLILDAKGSPRDITLDRSTFEFSIPKRNKVGITSPTYTKEGFIGGQVEFTVNVKNRGNWIDSFNLSVDSDWVELERSVIHELRPNGTWPVTMWVDIPEDASADTQPETTRKDPYKIRVWAYSQNETKEGQTLIYTDFFVQVAPFYKFELAVDENEKALQFSADHDGQARTVKIAVFNQGNIQDEIRLEFEDLPDRYRSWITISDSVVEDIPYDGVGYGLISINPRAGMVDPGWNNVTLIGTSMGSDQDSAKTDVLEIGIYFYQLKFRIDDMRINNETIPQDVGATNKDLDRRYSIQARITNIGTVDLDPTEFGKMYVVLYDGVFEVSRDNISYLPIGESERVYFAWTGSQPGPHPLTVSLEGSEDTLVSPEGDLELTRPVQVLRPPEVGDDEEEEIRLWTFLPQIIFLMILGFLIFLFLYGMSRIEISEIDTGYDEDGTYRPWAVKEKLREQEKSEKLASGEEKEALPQGNKPALPAASDKGKPQGVQPVSAGPRPGVPTAKAGPQRPAGQSMQPRPGQPMGQRPGFGGPPRPGVRPAGQAGRPVQGQPMRPTPQQPVRPGQANRPNQ